MSEPFREAQEPSEVSVKPEKPAEDKGSPIETKVPDLLVTHEDDTGTPYTAKYLEVENVWNDEPSLKRDVKEIEGYLRDQVKQGKVENSTKAAKQFLTDLERKAGLTRYESGAQKIEKLLAYIDFRRTVDA